MWDPDIGMGTVTHQNIGYLFPMGPYYTVLPLLGVPYWVAQRLWMGSLLFAAGPESLTSAGARSDRARLGRGCPGLHLSPYLIDYLASTSAIVMPWAGLGWMVGLTAMAARRAGGATLRVCASSWPSSGG